MEPSTSVTRGSLTASSRLWRAPRAKLSRTTISRTGSSSSWSTMCEPMKPAPPMTRTRESASSGTRAGEDTSRPEPDLGAQRAVVVELRARREQAFQRVRAGRPAVEEGRQDERRGERQRGRERRSGGVVGGDQRRVEQQGERGHDERRVEAVLGVAAADDGGGQRAAEAGQRGAGQADQP